MADQGDVGTRTEGLHLNITLIREPACPSGSARVRAVCWDFGIPPRETPATLVEGLRLEVRPGMIVLLTGPSGSGKSSLLAAIAERVGDAAWVGRGRFPSDRALVDAVAPRRPLAQALEVLTACGLGEPRLWLRRFDDLSDGERFRAMLARAIGEDEHKPIFCDEFTAILHRRLARAVSYNLRKLVTRTRRILFVASPHDDIRADLQPDVVIRLNGRGATVEQSATKAGPISLQRRARIEPGSVRDYATFGPMHYRHRDGLGFADKVFLLKESPDGEPLGILVFAYAPLELALRNQATEGRFVQNGRRLNRELRILRRLVMHPDVRGCGLGHWFVAQALPRVGVRFIECLAAMGAVNPVFERAGMTRVGRCPLPRGRMALLERMRAMKADPFAADFDRRVARCPRVRRLVEATIMRWNASLFGGGRPGRERSAAELVTAFRQIIGEPPVYYLWDRERRYPRAGEDGSTKSVDPREPRTDAGRPKRRDTREHDERSRERKRRLSPEGDLDQHDPQRRIRRDSESV